MIFENLFSFFFGVLLTFILQRLLGGNKDFFLIIERFKKKLPPHAKKAKTTEIDLFGGIKQMDLSKQVSHIEERDLDEFLKELEDFDYSGIIFRKKKIKSYSSNIQRLIKTTNFHTFKVGMLQELLENQTIQNLNPYLIDRKLFKYIKC